MNIMMQIKNNWLHEIALNLALRITVRERDYLKGFWNGPKAVCISFDCDFAEDLIASQSLLSLLRKEEVSSSFALTGLLTKSFPDIVGMIIDERHDIINHSFSHSGKFRDLDKDQMENEIIKFQEMMIKQFNYTPRGFRSPHGMRIIHNDFFEILKEVELFDSSFLGYGILNVNGVTEITITPCPAHPRTSFDSYHNFRLFITITPDKFMRLWDLVLSSQNFVNIFLDPRDIADSEGKKLLRKMIQLAKERNFSFYSLNMLATTSKDNYY